MNPETHIKREALDLGFDAVGITDPEAGIKPGKYLRKFLSLGRHGDMAWIEEKAAWRENPKALWPDVQSIVMVAMNYGPDENPLDLLENKSKGVFATYARGKDYHNVLKKRLKRLARMVHQDLQAEVKVFVDTAAVMEKPLAASAGLGWQGKHTNMVSRSKGSWLFLGALFTNLRLETDTPHPDHCGQCRACLDICPTNAFPAPYQLDARRCISYLTIEHKGHIPHEFRKDIGNRIYGCDDCLAICPWNKFAEKARETAFHERPATTERELDALLKLNDASFRERFAGSPVKRTGRNRFIRNVLIAAGNSQNKKLMPIIKGLLGDENSLVRAAAIWALAELDINEAHSKKSEYMKRETDPDVCREWQILD